MKKETEKEEKQSVNPEQYFVVSANVATAIQEYLGGRPLKEVQGLFNAFGQSETLKIFLQKNDLG